MASPTTGKFTIARGSNSHIWAVCEANGRFHLNGHFAGRFDEASGHVYDAKDQAVGRMQKLNPNCKDLFDRTGKNCFGTYVMNWQGRKPNQRPDGATVKPSSGAFSAEFNQNGAIYLNGQDWGVLNVCGSDDMEECFPAAAAISIYFGEHFLIDLQTQVAFADAPTVPPTYTAPAGSAAPAAVAPAAAAAAPAAAAGSSPTTGKFIVNRGGNAWAVIEDNGRFHIKGSFAGRFDEGSGHVYDAKDQAVGRMQKLNPNCKDLFDRTGKNCFGTYVMNWQGRKPNQRPDGATIKPSSGSFSAELNQNGAIYVNGADWGTINIPGSEDMEESFPSVAAVAIYFGDHFLLKDLEAQVAFDDAPTQP